MVIDTTHSGQPGGGLPSAGLPGAPGAPSGFSMTIFSNGFSWRSLAMNVFYGLASSEMASHYRSQVFRGDDGEPTAEERAEQIRKIDAEIREKAGTLKYTPQSIEGLPEVKSALERRLDRSPRIDYYLRSKAIAVDDNGLLKSSSAGTSVEALVEEENFDRNIILVYMTSQLLDASKLAGSPLDDEQAEKIAGEALAHSEKVE